MYTLKKETLQGCVNLHHIHIHRMKVRVLFQILLALAFIRTLVLTLAYIRSDDPSPTPEPARIILSQDSGLSKKERHTLCVYQTFHAVANVLNKEEIVWMPMFGTLLGVVRHGGLIPHDMDTDIVVLDEYMPRLMEPEFQKVLEKAGLELAWHTSHFFKIWPKDSPLETKNPDWRPGLYMKRPAVDVFSFSVDEINRVWTTTDFRRSYPLSWLYPLKKRHFGHTEVMVPRKAENVLTKDYGMNWPSTISGKAMGHKEKFKDFQPTEFKPAIPFLPVNDVTSCRDLSGKSGSSEPFKEFNASKHCNMKTFQNLQLIWRLFQEWRRISKKLNLRYTLWAGSFLAARRQKAFTPYDTDLDVQIDWEDTEKLEKFRKQYEKQNPDFILAVHPRWREFPLNPLGRGFAPEGFASPNARLILRKHCASQIDIWAVKHWKKNNTVSYYVRKKKFRQMRTAASIFAVHGWCLNGVTPKITKSSFQLITTSRAIVEPTEPCILEDPFQPVLCPKSDLYFKQNYHHTRVLMECKDGQWRLIKKP